MPTFRPERRSPTGEVQGFRDRLSQGREVTHSAGSRSGWKGPLREERMRDVQLDEELDKGGGLREPPLPLTAWAQLDNAGHDDGLGASCLPEVVGANLLTGRVERYRPCHRAARVCRQWRNGEAGPLVRRAPSGADAGPRGARLRFGTRTAGPWAIDLADGGRGAWPGKAPRPACHLPEHRCCSQAAG
jgi:hypothetical protein